MGHVCLLSSAPLYTEMLQDRDSTVFNQVVALPYPGHEMKLECINHAHKRMSTALTKLSAEVKLVGRGQGKLKAKNV